MTTPTAPQPETPIYGFEHLNRSWYAEHARGSDIIDEIIVSQRFRDGGVTGGELTMIWTEIGGKPTARLTVYQDGMALFTHPPVATLLQSLAKAAHQDITPDQFCQLLRDAGFEDLTETERPAD